MNLTGGALGRALRTGDRVEARHQLGGFFRPTVPRGTRGCITACAVDGAVQVAFVNGRDLLLDPRDVGLVPPLVAATDQTAPVDG